jgi:hypothetical protein
MQLDSNSRNVYSEEALRALGVFSTALNPVPGSEKEGDTTSQPKEYMRPREGPDLNDAVNRLIQDGPPPSSVPHAPPPRPLPSAPGSASADLQSFLQGNRIPFNVISHPGVAIPAAAPLPPYPSYLSQGFPMLGPTMGPAMVPMYPPMAGHNPTPLLSQPPWITAVAPSAAAAMHTAVPVVVPGLMPMQMGMQLPTGGSMPGFSSLFPTGMPPSGMVPKPKPPRSRYEPLLRRPVSSLDDDDSPTGAVECLPVWPGDCRGIIYQIASAFGRQPWQCPVLTQRVGVRTTPLTRGWPSDVVAPQFECQVCYTDNEPNAFAAVDLKTYRACITHYALAHRHSGPGRPPLEPYTGYFIRNWEMQGSNDCQTWDVISTHTNDSMINKFRPYGIAVVKQEQKKMYRHFRIRVVDPGNSQGTHALIISCLELYGKVEPIPESERHLYSDPPPPPPPPKPAARRDGKGHGDRRGVLRRKGDESEAAEGPAAAAAADAKGEASAESPATETPGATAVPEATDIPHATPAPPADSAPVAQPAPAPAEPQVAEGEPPKEGDAPSTAAPVPAPVSADPAPASTPAPAPVPTGPAPASVSTDPAPASAPASAPVPTDQQPPTEDLGGEAPPKG